MSSCSPCLLIVTMRETWAFGRGSQELLDVQADGELCPRVEVSWEASPVHGAVQLRRHLCNATSLLAVVQDDLHG